MKLVVLLLVLLILPVLPVQAATSGSPAKHQLTELTFAYFPLAVPISVLGETMRRDRILNKNLARFGFKLHFKPFAKGNDVQPLIRNGSIAAVSFADMPTIEAASTSDMLILGLIKQSYSAVVAPAGTQTRSLRGKRIGNAFGSTSHYALLQALSSVGLEEKDVTLVPMETSQMLDALENGTIDAFAAWEPTPAAALKKYPGWYTQINRQVSYSFFLLSGDLARTRPEVAREISAALVRAINWLKESNSNLMVASRWALHLMKDFTGKSSALNDRDIAGITRNDLLDIAGAPAIPKNFSHKGSLLFKEFDFLVQLGELPPNASRQRLEKSFSSSLLNDVISAPARYALKRYDYAR